MGTQTVNENEFNALQFEKRLVTLKDSQDSINACCQWCLQNRQHHKKIVNSWLNVLKRVKAEQRLVLFYLANDVVQYSKRRNYEYVESWGIALQKATTLVRDEKVKHKILRIFKIWEQRGVYNEEFISDLCGLISAVPSAPKGDEPHEFQPNYVINKIKTCTKLEKDTDQKLKMLKEHNPKIHIETDLCASLKDRAHVDDVEKEVEVYVKHMEDYINALKAEIKNRIALISVLKNSETQLEADRKDVKLVAHAYKMFGTRVKTFQKKLEEHMSTLSSPVPSPDINAPSPSPDSDIDLPDGDVILIEDNSVVSKANSIANAMEFNSSIQFTNAGYYTPVPAPAPVSTESNFVTNGFSSFIGSNMPFNLQNISSSIFGSNSGASALTNTTNSLNSSIPGLSLPSTNHPPPLPVEAPITPVTQTSNYPYPSAGQLPLLPPPPIPPFDPKNETSYNNTSFNTSYTDTSTTQFDNSYREGAYNPDRTFNTTYAPSDTSFNNSFMPDSFEPPHGANPYPPTEDYNPEQDIETWEPDASWMPNQETDTPESPPMFEKEGYADPIEYHDNAQSGAQDVDHRVIPGLLEDLGADDSRSSLGGKDVDHRNLISLTGSPAPDSNSNIPTMDVWPQKDQDYRNPVPSGDKDYRLPFDIENLKLPPPPPPPPKASNEISNVTTIIIQPSDQSTITTLAKNLNATNKSPRKFQDNVESIDMDLSEDENEHHRLDNQTPQPNENLKVIVDNSTSSQPPLTLLPPPPLPDLPDDEDANNFLDDLSNDLNEFSNLSDDIPHMLEPPPNMIQEQHPPPIRHEPPNMWPPLGPPPSMSFKNFSDIPSLPPPPPMMNMPPNPNWGMEENDNANWLPEGQDIFDLPPNEPQEMFDMMAPPDFDNWGPPTQQQNNSPSFNFRGRGSSRGNYHQNFNNNNTRGHQNRGRGRGGNFRGGNNNFRGHSPRGHRGGPRQRGNFRGNFRGGY